MSAGGLDASAGSRRFEYGAESVLALNREKDERADGAPGIGQTIPDEAARPLDRLGDSLPGLLALGQNPCAL